MSLVDPNASNDDLSDELLIQEFNYPVNYQKKNLYGLMSKRANSNLLIRRLLFDIVKNEEARKEMMFGFISHAWLPVLFMLQNSSTEVKLQLKDVLKQWSKDERDLFVNYIKREKEYYDLLKDIV